MSRFRRLAGISTSSCAAMIPLRMRVRKSAIGSVIDMASPARLRHAGDEAAVGEPADLIDAVVVDLREDDLLADAERVVAAAVERARAQPAEVAQARQGDRDQPVEELV